MTRARWWELEVARLATNARIIDGDDLVVSMARSAGASREGEGLSEHLLRDGLVSDDALQSILSLVGPVEYPCPECRLLFDIGDRCPEESILCPGCRAKVLVPSPESWAPPRPSETIDPNGLLGDLVDGLRFERILFQHGATTVYRAWEQAYDRPVAAKCLAREILEDSDALDRLRQEVRLSLDLHHPNLIPVLGLLLRGPIWILVSEYVEGMSGDDLLAQAGALPVHRSLHIACDVARALCFLHDRGMVHRDVKPGNIILGFLGEIRLGDLDLLERYERTGETVSEFVIGTPEYMAPELLRGGPASPATDVYSLGVTLYHLLAGDLPYEGDEFIEIATAVLEGNAPPVSAFRDDLPRQITELVERLMAPSPQNRPRTGPELESLLAEHHALVK